MKGALHPDRVPWLVLLSLLVFLFGLGTPGLLVAQQTATDSGGVSVDSIRPAVPDYELVSDVFSPNFDRTAESLLYEGPQSLRMHVERIPFPATDSADAFLEGHFGGDARADTLAGRWSGLTYLPDDPIGADDPHVAYRTGRQVVHVQPRFVMTILVPTDSVVEHQTRMTAHSVLAALDDGPPPPHILRRHPWSTTNVRAGPGTEHDVVAQLEPNTHQWVRRFPDRDWMVVFRGTAARDTLGWVLGELLHVDQYSPEQRRALEEKEAERRKQRQDAAAKRRAFAKRLEHEYLMDGRDMYVDTKGRWDTILEMRSSLFGRPEAYQMAHSDELQRNLAELGFTTVRVSNGREEWEFEVQ